MIPLPFQNVTKSLLSDELETESPMENESQGGEEEQQDPTLEQVELEQCEEQEKSSSSQPQEEGHEDGIDFTRDKIAFNHY